MRSAAWFLGAIVGGSLAGLAAVAIVAALTGCGPKEKPIVQPNPTTADCIALRGVAELACVRSASTRAEADDCIEKEKARFQCLDGGR